MFDGNPEGIRPQGGEIWLDVSRLLWRVRRAQMTGIDRVELSYAEHLSAAEAGRLRFVAFDYWRGRFGFLPAARTSAFVGRVGPCWREGRLRELWGEAAALFGASLFVLPRAGAVPGGRVRPTYLNVSSHPLHRTAAVGAMLGRTGAAFVPMLHDLIPFEMPEYVPRRWIREHRDCMATVSRFADGVILNSAATADAVSPHLPGGMPALAAPLGVSGAAVPRVPAAARGRPYFLCLGTVEPRKNHLLLLHLWRNLAAEMGENCPELVIAGRRGWENSHVFSLLDRCGALRPHVREVGRVSDAEVEALMRGAAALLMPSFAEGYGLPVAEALSRSLPVVCSDIPAHREVGGVVPDYLDPLDGSGWRRAVRDYAAPHSARRRAQMARMPGWRCATWDEHVSGAVRFVDAVAAGRAAAAAPPLREVLAA